MPLAAATLFLASALLFLVQPMTARSVLPLLGGTPAVWTTCMLFFQSALLAGYWYAHKSTRPLLHLVVVAAGIVPLCIVVPPFWEAFTGNAAIAGLLLMLASTIGLPFFVLATTSPLVQNWLATTAPGRDPYVLFAASNAGSLIGLLAYPLAVEPALALEQQRTLLAVGYAVVAIAIAACALRVRARATGTVARGAAPVATGSRRDRVRWLLLAFVPSSLLLGVTTHVTTNLAPVPLLWAIPLALYLLTFVFAFWPRRAGRAAARASSPPKPTLRSVFAALRPDSATEPAPPPALPEPVVGRRAALPKWLPSFVRWMDSPRPVVAILPAVLLPLVVMFRWEKIEHGFLILVLHLVAVFAVQWALHGRLADERPEPARLTDFYLWIALGGAVGGVCNALVAPFVFPVPLEYPLMLAAACLLLPGSWRPRRDVGWAAAIVALAVLLLAVLARDDGRRLLVLGPPAVLALFVAEGPLRLGLAVSGLLLVGASFDDRTLTIVHRARSVFGAHHVERLGEDVFCLVHGNILHGTQVRDAEWRREPLTYYHRGGPCGRLFTALGGRIPNGRVGAVGLGVGSIAAYAAPGEHWTFFEIDAAIERTAREQFTFLADSRGDVDVRIGDGRMLLRDTRDGEFGLILLDAFHSDAVPVHLMTREAVALYLQKLAPGGVLAFHVSSQYLELAPVLGDLAADLGLVARFRRESGLSAEDRAAMKEASTWVVLGRTGDDVAALAWDELPARAEPRVWTDSHASLWREMKVFR